MPEPLDLFVCVCVCLCVASTTSTAVLIMLQANIQKILISTFQIVSLSANFDFTWPSFIADALKSSNSGSEAAGKSAYNLQVRLMIDK
jgi:hypothetical protein